MRYRLFFLLILLLSVSVFAGPITVHKDLGIISYTELTKIELTSELILGIDDKDFKIDDISLTQVIYPDGLEYDSDFFTVNKNFIMIQPNKAKIPLPFGSYLALFSLSTKQGDDYILLLSFTFKQETTLFFSIPPYSETGSILWLDFNPQVLNCEILSSSDFELYAHYSPAEIDKPLEVQIVRNSIGASPTTLSTSPQKILSGFGSSDLQEFQFYIYLLGDFREHQTGFYGINLVFTLVSTPNL